MKIEVADAGHAQDTVRNLFMPYMHDMSEAAGIDVGEDGAFALPKNFATWWSEPGTRFPFLARADGKLAGLAFVRKASTEPPTYDMGEFFVLRRYRRAGVGRRFACQLFDRFPGRWEVRELPLNTAAQSFWRRIIADYTAGEFEDTTEYFPAYGREYVVQRFRAE